MRDFFIKSLEKLIGVIVVLGGIGVVVAAGTAAFMPQTQPGGPPGPLVALLILVGGAIYIVMLGGFMYLGVGIYHNTKRSADALDKLAGR